MSVDSNGIPFEAYKGELPYIFVSYSRRYLFLHEPLTFFDIRHQMDFLKKIRTFTRSPDVVAVGVVQDLNLAARFADQIVLRNAGKVVVTGAPADVLTTDRIEEIFAVKPIFIRVHSFCTRLILRSAKPGKSKQLTARRKRPWQLSSASL